jgi:hypothetical protein
MTRTDKLVFFALILVLAILLPSCAGTPARPTELKVLTAKVAVRAACPAKPEYAKLKAGRPTPLRSQPMPASPDARTAKIAAQLGRFEAEGGWADRVEAALDRCQEEDTIAPSP